MADATSDPRIDNLAAPETAEGSNKRRTRPSRQPCCVCGHELPVREIVRLDVLRPKIIERIRQEKPDLPHEGFICRSDLGRFRSNYVSELLTRERGELTQLELDLVKSLSPKDTLFPNTAHYPLEPPTL